MRTFGNLSIDVSGGKFFNKASMSFIDYKHFLGNRTLLLNNNYKITRETRKQLVTFKTLSYYDYSTTNQYLEAHMEHNFNSFFIGKIPLLRRTGIYEIIGSNMLITSKNIYTEYYVGLDKIFIFFRIDFASAKSNTFSTIHYYARGGVSIAMQLLF